VIAMRDGLELYLENVICRANLARDDERIVEAELREHLAALAGASPNKSTPREVYAMLEREFGPAKRVGSAIALAKGRLRTFLKKQMRIKPIIVSLVLALMVRWAVAQTFYAPSDAAAPQIPKGSRVLVYKLARSYSPGDVVVFRNHDGVYRIGIVQGTQSGGLAVRRNGFPDVVVPMDQVIGRVIFNTR
jgi:signal peptidase S26 family